MIRVSLPLKKVYVIAFCIALIAGGAGQALAAWTMVHGHSGHVEFKDRLANPNRYELGWGLDIDQKSGTTNWVHFSVPSRGESTLGARYIKLTLYSYSADSYVNEIHIYNGTTKVKTFTGSWSSGWKNLQFDLGSVMNFSKGLGISVKINAGVEMMSHRIVFTTAGANFVTIP